MMDALPALPPKLIELGHWISRYYLAPVGETFRAMLPPEIELRHDREYSLTEAGRTYAQSLANAEERTEEESAELEFLKKLEVSRNLRLPSSRVARLKGGEALAETFVRRGLLTAREVLRQRKTRTQKIVAWNAANDSELPQDAAEEKIRDVLTATRGPLPLPLLIEKAGVSRAVVQRLEKSGQLHNLGRANHAG